MKKHLVVAAGGTGGHIFPGIAVATVLQQSGWTVSWIGTRDRMEADVVPNHNIEIDFIEVKGVRGNGLKRLISAPWMVINAIRAATKVLKARKPAVVLTMGGYVTGPVGIAAKLLGIPLVIHEQNAVAGFSNRCLSVFATNVMAAFPGAFKHANVVGNPVRASVAKLQPKPVTNEIRVLIVGGSLGAQVFNEVLPEAVQALRDIGSIAVRHQTGRNNQSATQARYQQAGCQDVHVEEFIRDMDNAYAWADIVICRAGALTVSEVAAAGKLAVFVPFPHAVDDHQTANARFLVDGGAAHLIAQKDFNKDAIVALLRPYFAAHEEIFKKAQMAKQLATLDASERVAQVCEVLTGECPQKDERVESDRK
ncbi:UDP-N-acetylglucosamine--N-acetylmuramyl-(pentapeptide) pyrophosphoryl-undecaprenol N-acetylglucosamine transferase [Pseudoalteromonas luteoviolacea B = ATCC 29581]|nr:UDP-N-acetylglucosamine--N-acetylmuramyl-(pentapeptide) pyrophosphoryl-undecaprenol N-acetylglucosamine transferase [Pseudoalteromonas luteoviolacea B = ATCC 29581]